MRRPDIQESLHCSCPPAHTPQRVRQGLEKGYVGSDAPPGDKCILLWPNNLACN